jgi:hypothetical protein
MVIEEFGPILILILGPLGIVIGIANVGLLSGLLHAYWKTYKQVKSEFTIGLLYFASFLLIQNVVSTLFLALLLVMPLEFHGSEIHGPRLPLFLVNIVQLIALIILFRITRK